MVFQEDIHNKERKYRDTANTLTLSCGRTSVEFVLLYSACVDNMYISDLSGISPIK